VSHWAFVNVGMELLLVASNPLGKNTTDVEIKVFSHLYETLKPDTQRVLRSEIFPGLWLNPAAIFNGDLVMMLAILQQGLASPEHSGSVARPHEG
jgi:hypothetical protein